MSDKKIIATKKSMAVQKVRTPEKFELGTFIGGAEYEPMMYSPSSNNMISEGKEKGLAELKGDALARIISNAPLATTPHQHKILSSHIRTLAESVKPIGNPVTHNILREGMSTLTYCGPYFIEDYVRSSLAILLKGVTSRLEKDAKLDIYDEYESRAVKRLLPYVPTDSLNQWAPGGGLPSVGAMQDVITERDTYKSQLGLAKNELEQCDVELRYMQSKLNDTTRSLGSRNKQIDDMEDQIDELQQEVKMLKAQLLEKDVTLQKQQSSHESVLTEMRNEHQKAMANVVKGAQDMVNRNKEEAVKAPIRGQDEIDMASMGLKRTGTDATLKREEAERTRKFLKEKKILKEVKTIEDEGIRPWITYAWDAIYKTGKHTEEAIEKATEFTNAMMSTRIYEATMMVTCANSQDIDMFYAIQKSIAVYTRDASEEARQMEADTRRMFKLDEKDTSKPVGPDKTDS